MAIYSSSIPFGSDLDTEKNTLPDMAFLSGVNRLCKECAERHPEMYGVMKDADQDKELAEAMLDEAAREEFAKAAEKTEGGL